MSFRLKLITSGLLALSLSGLSCAQEKLYVQDKASFINENGVREKIRDQCDLEDDVGRKAYQAITRVAPGAIAIADQPPPQDGASITLAIMNVAGNGGSGWTGAKSMAVKADYRIGAEIVSTKLVSASSHGGFWGGFKGICSILQRDSTAISKQLANWVKSVRTQTPESLVAATQSTAAEPQENTIYLISPIAFSEDAEIRQAIRDECALPLVAENYMKRRAHSLQYKVQPVTRYDNRGTALRVTIGSVVGYGGGAFSGEKTVTARADLLKDGIVVASQNFERTINGAVFTPAVYAGTCRTLDGLVKSFSVLTVNWAVAQLAPPVAPITSIANNAPPPATSPPLPAEQIQ